MQNALGFPKIVNEKAARVVAGLVALVAGLALLTGTGCGSPPGSPSGSALRVASGPASRPLRPPSPPRLIAPRLGEPVLVAGPPKRFAQGVGLVLTTVATVALVLGAPTVTTALLGVLVVFALLESVVGFCAGCWVFGYLMRWGLVPEARLRGLQRHHHPPPATHCSLTRARARHGRRPRRRRALPGRPDASPGKPLPPGVNPPSGDVRMLHRGEPLRRTSARLPSGDVRTLHTVSHAPTS